MRPPHKRFCPRQKDRIQEKPGRTPFAYAQGKLTKILSMTGIKNLKGDLQWPPS